MAKTWKFLGINFDHMHMGDLLRQVHEHPDAEIAGVCDADPARMAGTIATFAIPADRVFTDVRRAMETAKPDVVILCPATGLHADYVEQVAPFGTHVFVEKPFAASLKDADRMIAAMRRTGRSMVVNWPLAWYPPHRTAKRLLDEGRIGELREVHYYDGNRGPMRHVADHAEVGEAEANRRKAGAWWYQRAKGGGSLQDYLGYGATLGTWYQNGRAPLEVTAMTDERPGLEVDEHSVTVARYAHGLSTFQTRWGTFTDPWTNQPQPKCGFVLVGSAGTIASYDYEGTIRVQDAVHPEGETVPVDVLPAGSRGAIEHVIRCYETGEPVLGPLDPATCRIGQQIVDTAALSAREKRTLKLVA